jgi:hypothetical protein
MNFPKNVFEMGKFIVLGITCHDKGTNKVEMTLVHNTYW